MIQAKTKKVIKVLYLYLTIPLVLLTAVLFMVSLMSPRHHRVAEGQPVAPYQQELLHPSDVHSSRMTSAPSDAGLMQVDSPIVQTYDQHVTFTITDAGQPDTKVPLMESTDSSSTGSAAIITAIMGGLTGMLGVLMQGVIAYFGMRERRKVSTETTQDFRKA